MSDNALSVPHRTPAATKPRFDAFLSYSHAAKAKLAPALQAGLQQLARPWHRLRAMRVFRDRTTLAVTPALWPAIEAALATSRWIIYLGSPEAAASEWVEKELKWWLEHRGTDRMLIVITDGEAEWDDARNTFDAERSSAIPLVLRSAFPHEPGYLDLRWATREERLTLRIPAFRDAVAELAAAVHGRSKDDLDSEDVRQHRKTRRIARAAIAALVLLTVASVSTSVVAVRQRDLAETRRRVTLARQLAAEATIMVARSPARLPLALALAAEALGRDRSSETERALRSLLSLRPRPVLVANTSGDIMDVALDGDGRWVAGLDFSGDVGVWSVPDSATAALRWPETDSLLLWAAGSEAPPRALAIHSGANLVANGDGDVVQIRSAATGERLLMLQAGDTVRAVDFHPSATLIASGADDGFVRIWSLADGGEVARLDSGDPIRAVAFSPDGRRVASLDVEGGLCVFDPVDEAAQLCRLTGGISLALAWSSDGSRLATAVENAALVWDLEGEQPLARLEHMDPIGYSFGCCDHWVDAVAFSPDGRLVATGGRDASARVWDTATGRELTRLPHALVVQAVRFTPDGRTLLTASEDGTVRAWDALRGNERLRGTHDFGALSVSLDSAGGLFASGARDGAVRVWRLAAADERLRLPHDTPLVDVAVAPDGQRFATLDDMGVIRVWSPDGRLFARGRPPSYRVTLLLFTSNDRLLAWRSDDPFTMDLRATADSTLGATLLLDRSSTPALAYSRDHVVTETRVFGDGFNRPEQLVVLASEDADTVARIAVPEFTGQLDLAPDGGSLAFERRPGEIAVLELPSARGVANIPAGAEVYGLSLADGPAAVTTVLRGGVVRLWRLDRGTVREVPLDTATRAEEAILSPAGDHLVIPGGNVVAVHDARTGRPIARLLHDTDVDRIRFAADTAILVTLAGGRVHIWELDTGRLVAELGGDTYYRDVAFLNHDRDLLTVDADGYAVVRVWRTEDVLRAACDQLDAPLSPAEWAEYLPGEPYRPVCAR